MGLIARALEARGIPTLSLTSAWSITAAVKPPRAVFVDFPLGHTAGRPHDTASQHAIIDTALTAFATITEPGTIIRSPLTWSDDDAWKDAVMVVPTEAAQGDATADPRGERHAQPQYQSTDDRERALAKTGTGGCTTCVFVEPHVEAIGDDGPL